jgi:hypothetical protein
MIFTMLMKSYSKKRLIATLLPLSLLWVSAACVSFCARESAERHSYDQPTTTIVMKGESDCKGCPLNSFPKSSITRRSLHRSDLQPPPALHALMLSVDSWGDEGAVGLLPSRRSAADPPLKRLPALRI